MDNQLTNQQIKFLQKILLNQKFLATFSFTGQSLNSLNETWEVEYAIPAIKVLLKDGGYNDVEKGWLNALCRWYEQNK
jgi:hypothetical protein